MLPSIFTVEKLHREETHRAREAERAAQLLGDLETAQRELTAAQQALERAEREKLSVCVCVWGGDCVCVCGLCVKN